MGDERDERDELDDLDLRVLRGAAPPAADDDLARLGEIVRSLSADDLTVDEPPAAVWEAIAARTGSPRPSGPPVSGPGGAPEGAAASPTLRPVEGGRHEDRATAPGPDAPRPPAATRPLRRPWGLAAAAAALVLVVAVGAVTFARRDDDGDGSVVASAELEPLPDEPTGSATPVRADLVDDQGRLQLDLSIGDLPAADGYFEVWLIDTNVEGMVSLGPARADGRYAVPSDVDPGQFPIVDVSIEPPDGDPTHSGVSVLRGTLA
jgi:Anti-sigma-K factor rskA